MKTKWAAVFIACAWSAIFSAMPAHAAKLHFGADERIHFVQDVSLQGPQDEDLYLGRMVVTKSFLLPYVVKDEGFVLGVTGDSHRYFSLPEEATVQAMQSAGLLPNPLPPYELTTLDLVMGNLLWLFVAGFAVYGGYKYLTRKTSAPDDGSDTVADAPAPVKIVTPYTNKPIDLPMTLRPSPLKMLGLLVISAVFVTMGIFMSGEEPVMGYLCAGFFGLCGVVAITALIPGSAFLLLERDGFTFSSLFRKHSYQWRDIARFGVTRISRNSMVCWEFSPSFTGPKRGAKFSKSLTGVEAALPDTYGKKADDLADLMNELRQRG